MKSAGAKWMHFFIFAPLFQVVKKWQGPPGPFFDKILENSQAPLHVTNFHIITIDMLVQALYKQRVMNHSIDSVF